MQDSPGFVLLLEGFLEIKGQAQIYIKKKKAQTNKKNIARI